MTGQDPGGAPGPADAHELDAERITRLLTELDERLRRRGVAAALFVVGGAAVAATGLRRDRVTRDVDALTAGDTLAAVLEEAHALATEHGLPPTWLNSSAAAWMPPLPAGSTTPPDVPGLRVTYADDGFLLATKLVAQRAKDVDDIVALADRLGLRHATADQLRDHVLRHYTDPEQLLFVLDGVRDEDDVAREVSLLAQDAARALSRAHQAPPPGDAT
ncbi:hypothetical protein [Kineococcus terrestris]|uniref:hypothetical protein n=1 Tax=Kineococcus terrestris TaxID=2044856 RepID=UPI0034DB5CC1